jgi:two-component sensor histidine kinase
LLLTRSPFPRAAALVKSFKQVAVDQSSGDIRRFNLGAYVNEVLLSLQPKLKGKPVTVEVDCPNDLQLESHPGAVSQILTNMVMNSLVHGFEDGKAGRIGIRAAHDGDTVTLEYADDGIGMDQDTLGKLFDPFFTTKRGSGGSGLGAHILYNLATGALGGSVRVDSAPGEGLRYQLRFPRSLRAEKAAACSGWLWRGLDHQFLETAGRIRLAAEAVIRQQRHQHFCRGPDDAARTHVAANHLPRRVRYRQVQVHAIGRQRAAEREQFEVAAQFGQVIPSRKAYPRSAQAADSLDDVAGLRAVLRQ